ncbi:MAG: hypothetical protein ACI9YE_001128 [Psychroserpens sp.]|jgi:hypothetical protein
MNQTGIYEQLITQLVEHNLDRESFFVGERSLEAAEAATWLSRFLTRIIEIAMDSVPNSDNRIQEQIGLANTIVQWLSTCETTFNLKSAPTVRSKHIPLNSSDSVFDYVC